MLYLACDHAGFYLKEAVKKHLSSLNISFTDFGCESEAAADYPIYAKKALDAMSDREMDRVFLFCGTGIGMQLCANRVSGVRAVCASDAFSVRHSRSHNNANVLCFGGRVIGPGAACEFCDLFLQTPFDGQRHAKRLSQIDTLFS